MRNRLQKAAQELVWLKDSKSVWQADGTNFVCTVGVIALQAVPKEIRSMSLKEESVKSNHAKFSRRALCMAMVSGTALLTNWLSRFGLKPHACSWHGHDSTGIRRVWKISPLPWLRSRTAVLIPAIRNQQSSARLLAKSLREKSRASRLFATTRSAIGVTRTAGIHWTLPRLEKASKLTRSSESSSGTSVCVTDPTLYCGTSDVTLSVIDVATGEVDFTKSLEEYRYPTMAGQHTSETTESRFRKLYLQTLAEEIGRSFHPYDMSDRSCCRQQNRKQLTRAKTSLIARQY